MTKTELYFHTDLFHNLTILIFTQIYFTKKHNLTILIFTQISFKKPTQLDSYKKDFDFQADLFSRASAFYSRSQMSALAARCCG
jgi:hypothetical protein